MLIAVLFTIAKIWKQPKYPSIEERIKKMCYIYIYIYTQWNIIQPQKKNEILPFVTTWIGLRQNYAKRNKSEKDNYHMISLIYVKSKKQTSE